MSLDSLLRAARLAGVPESLVEQAAAEQRGKNLALAPRYFILGGPHTYFSDDDATWSRAGQYVVDTVTLRR